MPQPFWDIGVDIGRGIDCLLPDVSVQNVLPPFWSWKVIYMAGRRVPGLCHVTFKRAHRVDKRAASGTDNPTVTSLGYDGAEVIIEIRLWTPQQLIDYQAITIPSVQPAPGKAGARPKSVKVSYPSLSMYGVKSLFVTEIAGPEPTSTHGVWKVVLTATQTEPMNPAGSVTQKGGGVSTAPNVYPGQPAKPPSAPPSESNNNPTFSGG